VTEQQRVDFYLGIFEIEKSSHQWETVYVGWGLWRKEVNRCAVCRRYLRDADLPACPGPPFPIPASAPTHDLPRPAAAPPADRTTLPVVGEG